MGAGTPNDLDDSPTQAIEYGQRLVADLDRFAASITPTARSAGLTSRAYRAAGRLAEAIPLFEATLADRERILGRDHPDALASRNNLARAYRSAGRLDEAIPLFEATSPTECAFWAATTPTPLTSRGYLAYAYRSAGRLDEASRCMRPHMPTLNASAEPAIPTPWRPRHYLAHAYLLAGRLDEAILLYETSLTDRERVLGGDHPDTLLSRNNLAARLPVGRAARRCDPAS